MAKETNNKPQTEHVDLLDILLDTENREPIVLRDDKGRAVSFEQVAVIPYADDGGERSLYVVLKPLDEIEGVADDEAIVFRVEVNDDDESFLVAETDEHRARAVFDQYYEMVEEANKANKA